MKIALHVLGYNVSRFLPAMLENCMPHVDRVYIAHSKLPFAYSKEARGTYVNPTTIQEVRALCVSDKIRIVEGDWLTEEAMRNSCFELAKSEGFDWMVIQDADEFYSESCWEQIRKQMLKLSSHDHIITTWYNFWKSSQYVLVHPDGDIKHINAGFAVRCNKGLQFVDRRITNAKQSIVLDIPCYHYGYVMSDLEMREKLDTWSHSHQVNIVKWYNRKWLHWSTATRHLHPVQPWIWNRAIRFPLEQPEFAHEFALSFSKSPSATRAQRLCAKLDEVRVDVRQLAVGVKNILK